MSRDSERKGKKCSYSNYVVVSNHESRFIHYSPYFTAEFQLAQIKRDNPGCEVYEVPCGKCAYCISQKLHTWYRSLMAESLMCEVGSFYTFTFDDDNLPHTLNAAKVLFQNFIKRLRRDGLKFKYFVVSENGERTGRLHFHALFFGLPPNLDTIRGNWPYGFIKSDILNPGTIHYVCDYIFKGQNLRLYSKKLGYGYFDKLTAHGEHSNYYGQSLLLPRRYYRKKFWSESFRQSFVDYVKSLPVFSENENRIINKQLESDLRRKGKI